MRIFCCSLAVLALAAGTAAADPWTRACRTAIEEPAPDAPTLAACLPSHAGLIVSGLVGYQADLASGGGVSAFLRVDKPIGSRLWLEAKGRFHSQMSFQGDLLVGLVLRHAYGTGYASFNSNVVDTPGTRTITVTSQRNVLRRDLVLAGGIKTAVGVADDMGVREKGVFGALGLQRHAASGFGTHSVIEGFVIAGPDGVGGTVAWHNSIPPTHGLVFGMEAGYVPQMMIYWAIVELGYSFEV